jgi:hypothetical protein
MAGVIRRKRKTLLGKIVRKIESELSQNDEHVVSFDLPTVDSNSKSDDAVAIKLRREELKSNIKGASDVIKFGDL